MTLKIEILIIATLLALSLPLSQTLEGVTLATLVDAVSQTLRTT